MISSFVDRPQSVSTLYPYQLDLSAFLLVWINQSLTVIYPSFYLRQLDPSSLENIGEHTFDGVMKSGQPVSSHDPRMEGGLKEWTEDAFTAHARIDGEVGR